MFFKSRVGKAPPLQRSCGRQFVLLVHSKKAGEVEIARVVLFTRIHSIDGTVQNPIEIKEPGLLGLSCTSKEYVCQSCNSFNDLLTKCRCRGLREFLVSTIKATRNYELSDLFSFAPAIVLVVFGGEQGRCFTFPCTSQMLGKQSDNTL